MSLGNYTIQYIGGFQAGGTVPKALTFASLGVTACKIVQMAGGGDYAEITVDTTISSGGLPFLPLTRTNIIGPDGTVRFSGWLTRPGASANGSSQQQTFRFDGPNYLLANTVYKQDWMFAVDPTDYNSALGKVPIARVILNLQDYTTGFHLSVADQIKAILDYVQANKLGSDTFAYGSLAAIPAVQPPEDEQVDMYADTLVQRQLKWTPMVTSYWTYPAGVATLNFSAYEAAANVGAAATGQIIVDLASGTIISFKSEPRYDLLLGKVHIDYMQENDLTDDGSITGTRKLWAVNSTDESTVDNGSLRELNLSMDLRGAGGPRDATTGLLSWPQENPPVGLAAAIHGPFKQLTHSLSWSVTDADVDWATVPGLAVGVKNAGPTSIGGARSIIQQITRDLKTGTTSYEAGPPRQLASGDITALTRYSVTRNSARGGGGGGGGGGCEGYSKKGGPDQKQHGVIHAGCGGGGALGPVWFNVTCNGYGAYCQINAGNPTDTLPDGAFSVNMI